MIPTDNRFLNEAYDLFDKPSHAAVAVHLGLLMTAVPRYIWQERNKITYYYKTEDTPDYDDKKEEPAALLFPEYNEDFVFHPVKASVKNVYYIHQNKKMAGFSARSLEHIKRLNDRAKQKYPKMNIDNLIKDVEYFSQYIYNTDRRNSLILGLAVAHLEGLVIAGASGVAVLASLVDFINEQMRPYNQNEAASLASYVLEQGVELAEKLDGLKVFAKYEDGYYLGKMLGNALAMTSLIVGSKAAIEAFNALCLGTAVGSGGVLAFVAVPAAALVDATVVSATTVAVYTIGEKFGGDRDKFENCRAENSKKAQEIADEANKSNTSIDGYQGKPVSDDVVDEAAEIFVGKDATSWELNSEIHWLSKNRDKRVRKGYKNQKGVREANFEKLDSNLDSYTNYHVELK